MGAYVSLEGFDNVYLLAPNYPAGRDALTGFKRFYEGGIAGEVYTQLGQTDYAAELANLRAAGPDAVFFFYPGGMGINFVKQAASTGISQEVPFFGPAFSFDDHGEDHRQKIGPVILGVPPSAERGAAGAFQAERGGVHARHAEVGEEVTAAGEQRFFETVLDAAPRKRRGMRLRGLGQRLPQPSHQPQEAADPSPKVSWPGGHDGAR